MPACGPVPRELHEAKGAARRILDLGVFLVVGQGIAAYSRGRHCCDEVFKDAIGGLGVRSIDRRNARASAERRRSFVVVVDRMWWKFLLSLFVFFSRMPATDEEERAAEPAAAPAAPATAASDEPGPSSAADSAAQINRPSNKRRRNLRQTRVTAGDDDNDDKDDADGEQGNNKTPACPTVDHATLIEDTRALQKQRGRRTVGILDCFTARRDATRGE